MDIEMILKKIKNERKKQNITIKSIISNFDRMSISSYSKRENGKTPITLEEYLDICSILNKSPQFFLK